MSSTEESNTSVWNVRAGEFRSRKNKQYQEKYLEQGFIYFTTESE
jgi:hypothetical protein